MTFMQNNEVFCGRRIQFEDTGKLQAVAETPNSMDLNDRHKRRTATDRDNKIHENGVGTVIMYQRQQKRNGRGR